MGKMLHYQCVRNFWEKSFPTPVRSLTCNGRAMGLVDLDKAYFHRNSSCSSFTLSVHKLISSNCPLFSVI